MAPDAAAQALHRTLACVPAGARGSPTGAPIRAAVAHRGQPRRPREPSGRAGPSTPGDGVQH